jgi:transcriptional regulator with XRE-family HTH domain
MLAVSYGVMEFTKKLENLIENQSELARKTGIPQSAISEMISGKRKPYFVQMAKIAQALGVSLDYLGDDRQAEPPPGLSREDEEILKMVRMLGHDAAKARLMLAPSSTPAGESYDSERDRKKKRSKKRPG